MTKGTKYGSGKKKNTTGKKKGATTSGSRVAGRMPNSARKNNIGSKIRNKMRS